MKQRQPSSSRPNCARSAVGRAHLAFCPDAERESILEALRTGQRPGDVRAHDRRYLRQLLDETRRTGYGARETSFGGAYDKSRAQYDDGLSALAVPIAAPDGSVAACINIVWIERLFKVEEMAARHLGDLQAAAARIAGKIREE